MTVSSLTAVAGAGVLQLVVGITKLTSLAAILVIQKAAKRIHQSPVASFYGSTQKAQGAGLKGVSLVHLRFTHCITALHLALLRISIAVQAGIILAITAGEVPAGLVVILSIKDPTGYGGTPAGVVRLPIKVWCRLCHRSVIPFILPTTFTLHR